MIALSCYETIILIITIITIIIITIIIIIIIIIIITLTYSDINLQAVCFKEKLCLQQRRFFGIRHESVKFWYRIRLPVDRDLSIRVRDFLNTEWCTCVKQRHFDEKT